ncbi:glucose-6-phosphatase 2 [Aricia agestis]|uniref:glucose-6-phosphatase 2 n=1 Tax=Aricia agestis TaxID=91739 RepID=UPI001C206612|nr:glucose-6-phosphatase 2 [Aricia agestis]
MEQIYALGVICIEFIQYWFKDWEDYFTAVNNLANPNYVLLYLLPFVSVFDSVFASQLLVVMGVGGWMNSLLKWWFLEDRPFWWVRETTFYSEADRPVLRQTTQTCETGPGSPSGHSTTAASVLILLLMWISHICNDRKWTSRWWKPILFSACGAALGAVLLARMYIATHFPHQCLLGALIGAFLAPALCIYVTDPFIWQYGSRRNVSERRVMMYHVAAVFVAMTVSAITYFGLKLFGVDPHYTVKLAFRWCLQPDYIHVSTTPVFALVQTAAAALAAAAAVTPATARYRHYTKNRSLLISIFLTILSMYTFRILSEHITRDNVFYFYSLNFLLHMIQPIVHLRLVPALAMWPFRSKKQKTQ